MEDYHWRSAIQCVNQERDFITGSWIKRIPDAKKGYSQFECIFYEECNRGPGGLCRGIVGEESFSANMQSAEIYDCHDILSLFPETNNKTKSNFIKNYKDVDSLYRELMDIEEELYSAVFDKYQERLYTIISDLCAANGFSNVRSRPTYEWC